MKKIIFLAMVFGMVAMLGAPGLYAQQAAPQPGGGWYCPWMGNAVSTAQGGWYCPMMRTAASTGQGGWHGPGIGHMGRGHMMMGRGCMMSYPGHAGQPVPTPSN